MNKSKMGHSSPLSVWRRRSLFRKFSVPALTVAVMIWSVCGVSASDSPMNALKTNVDKIVSILKTYQFQEQSGKTKEAAVYEVAKKAFDFRTLSMLALGTNWRRFSDDQKTEFSKYFSRLITQVYLSKIEGEDLDSIQIDYLKSEAVTADSKIKRYDVYTSITHDGVQTPVVYRMLKNKNTGEWKVYDVKIEGVSMAGNYREQYRKRFMDTPETMIEEIRSKVEK